MTTISSLGIMLQANSGLLSQQKTLAKLNEQLASHKQHTDLTDYGTVQVGRLLNFQNSIAQKNSFLDTLTTVNNRLIQYDTIMGDLSDIATQANTLSTQNQSYDASKLSSLRAQADNYLRQITQDLNSKLSDRYLFSGIRYTTAPVSDLSALSTTPSATMATNPTLPEYDVNYASTTDANAYVVDSATISQGNQLSYGITSNDPSIQGLIAGIRFIKEATNSPDAATYQANMSQATTLLGSALTGIQTIHANVANNQNVVSTMKNSLTSEITNLENQVGDIQQVDITEVSTAITLLQTQLQASYSATGKLIQLSILNYL